MSGKSRDEKIADIKQRIAELDAKEKRLRQSFQKKHAPIMAEQEKLHRRLQAEQTGALADQLRGHIGKQVRARPGMQIYFAAARNAREQKRRDRLVQIQEGRAVGTLLDVGPKVGRIDFGVDLGVWGWPVESIEVVAEPP
jgi:hypothetical protein